VPETSAEVLVRHRKPLGLGKKRPQRKRQISCGHAAGDILQRDSGLFERGHQADDVHVCGRQEPVVKSPEDAKLNQPMHIVERARGKLGDLPLRDPGHRSTLAGRGLAKRTSEG
jgi:hypothetical protein